MSQTVENLNLRGLPPEKWGSQLRRCRESAGFTLEKVAEITDGLISRSALAAIEAIENRATRPLNRRQRLRAATAMVIYGRDPKELGLSLADLGVLDPARLRDLGREHAPVDLDTLRYPYVTPDQPRRTAA